jgi:hypothetical protein
MVALWPSASGVCLPVRRIWCLSASAAHQGWCVGLAAPRHRPSRLLLLEAVPAIHTQVPFAPIVYRHAPHTLAPCFWLALPPLPSSVVFV